MGVELGVHRADFAMSLLENWKSVRRYYLVDIWAHQENYKDISNVQQDLQARGTTAALCFCWLVRSFIWRGRGGGGR